MSAKLSKSLTTEAIEGAATPCAAVEDTEGRVTCNLTYCQSGKLSVEHYSANASRPLTIGRRLLMKNIVKSSIGIFTS